MLGAPGNWPSMLPPFMGVEPSGMPLLLGWKAIFDDLTKISSLEKVWLVR